MPLRRGLPLDQPRERPPSPREAARWITTHSDRRGLHVTHRLHRLLEHCPELKRTHDLVRRFAAMLDNRGAAPLSSWLDELSHSGLPPLTGIAGSPREDQHAVTQGIITTYSSGVNEGRITDVRWQNAPASHPSASPGQLCSWAGLTPRHRASDTKIHRGPITRQGSPLLRWACVEAVQRCSADTPMRRLKDRITQRRGVGARNTAAARKLLTLVFYALRDGEVRCLAKTAMA